MGVKTYSLAEGRRYRVQTPRSVFFGTFVDRETVDGEQFLLFVVEGRSEDDFETKRIRARAIRSVNRDVSDE